MMNQLRNCPNCGGYLNDSGRCEFCGSKIYDFVAVDFDDCRKTYIRIKSGGKVLTMQVLFHTADISISSDPISTEDILGMPFTVPCYRRSGSLEFDVIGDNIYEEGDE